MPIDPPSSPLPPLSNAPVANPVSPLPTYVPAVSEPQTSLPAYVPAASAPQTALPVAPALPSNGVPLEDRILALEQAYGSTGSQNVATTDPRLSDAREWSAETISQVEAEGGAATTRRAWTAQRVRQAILAWWNTLSVGFRNFVTSPTSDNFALWLTNPNGTGGGFVRATGATLTGVTLNGATIPNQTAPVDNDVVNRRTTLLGTANIIDLTAGSTCIALGTGATARRSGGVARVLDGDLSTSAVLNAALQITLATGGVEGHWDLNRAIHFNRRWVLYKKITLSAATNVQQFFAIGAGSTINNHALGLPTSGDSAGWVLDSPTSLRLWRCNSGVITYSPPIDPVGVTASATTEARHIWLECNANTLQLFMVTRAFGTGVPAIPATPLLTLTGLPNFPNQNGIVLVLRATAASPSAFSAQNLMEAKLINY